jgi:tRNA dimethylallyltransferase
VALVGPTACGKSGVALELAPLMDGEIVSLDSMQVYRGMDIGTAKPDAAAQKRVRHHLLDLLGLGQSCDAATFRDAAIPVISELLRRGKIPILCGGTGFYFAALSGRLGMAAGSERELRAELEAAPTNLLLEELLRVDPDAYSTIDRHNRRRVVRAVESIRLTGRPFSQQRLKVPGAQAGPAWAEESSWHTFGLLRDADDLKSRIETRVEQMFDRGLVGETERLLELGLEENRTAMQAIGYRQVVEYLRGERSLEETRELVKRKTRQFAKRQMTWFRRQMRVTWLRVGSGETERETADRIVGTVGLHAARRHATS